MDRKQLQEIVKTATFNSLIGQVENDWFDCKKEPYQLQNNEDVKRELAKDVSSFANVGGGYIFIGVKTKKSTERFGDEVDAIHPFSQALVDVTQYRNVLGAWVYPEIEGLDIHWVEVDSTKHRGLIVITIPSQKEAVKPFIINKTLDEKKRVETFFGYAQRKGDSSKPLTAAELQQTLRLGLNYQATIKERFDSLDTLVRSSVISTLETNAIEVQKKNNGERIEQRLARALEYEGFKDDRSISIAAYLTESTELKTIFLSSESSLRKQFENPPILRYGGWNLRHLDQAKILHGEMLRVTNGRRLMMDLYRDGTFIFVGRGDHQFLAWHDAAKQKINPVALIEILYEYFNFYKNVLEDSETKLSTFTVRLDLRNLHLAGLKTSLSPYRADSYSQIFDHDKKDAPDSAMNIEKKFSVDGYDATEYAFQISKEVYLWFGLEEDKIPYVKEDNGRKFIDIDALKII